MEWETARRACSHLVPASLLFLFCGLDTSLTSTLIPRAFSYREIVQEKTSLDICRFVEIDYSRERILDNTQWKQIWFADYGRYCVPGVCHPDGLIPSRRWVSDNPDSPQVWGTYISDTVVPSFTDGALLYKWVHIIAAVTELIFVNKPFKEGSAKGTIERKKNDLIRILDIS